MVAEDHKSAIASGADAFLPKPMLQAAERALEDGIAGKGAAQPLAKPEVAVLEDNPFMREAWVDALAADSTVHAVDSPEAFADMLSKDPGLLGRLACVVTDLNFDNSTQSGVDVGRLIKRHRPGLRVLLCSDGLLSQTELGRIIDQVIPKDPLSYAGLERNWSV